MLQNQMFHATKEEIDSTALGYTMEEHKNVSDIRVWEIVIDVEAHAQYVVAFIISLLIGGRIFIVITIDVLTVLV